MKKEQCPVISSSSFLILFLFCHICFRCSSVFSSMERVTTTHDCWPHTINYPTTRKKRTKKERNNCYRTYAALDIALAVIAKMENDQKADYEIKVFFDLISRRFSPLFFIKQWMLWWDWYWPFRRIDIITQKLDHYHSWRFFPLTSCMIAVLKTIVVNWSRKLSYSCRWHWFSTNNRPFSCSSWRICSWRERVCWVSTLVVHY